MINQQIKDANMSIAIFLEETGGIDNNKEVLFFQSNWNHLMLVVDRIEEMGYDTIIELDNPAHSCQIKEAGMQIVSWRADTKKSAVYGAILEFVKRHKRHYGK